MKKILILIFIFFLSFTLSACLVNSEPKSAYDIAVENGFVGTEEEWLESLKGEDGKSLHILDIYNAAILSGEFNGSLLEFVEVYFDGVPIEGKSAYDVYVESLEDPSTAMSEADWLASLKGDKGESGADGEKGDAIDLYQTYLQLINLGSENGGLDKSVTFFEFVKEYLNVDVNTSNQTVISKAILSAVQIFALNDNILNSDKTINKNSYGSGGAGVIYSLNKIYGDAYIITNYHVVFDFEGTKKPFENIYVNLYGDESLFTPIDENHYNINAIEAECIGGSATYDIAVLRIRNSKKIKESDAKAVEIFDSNNIVAGMTAIAIGNPQGDGISVTEGIVSVDSEEISMSPLSTENVQLNEIDEVTMRVMRIDTSVNSGNSGGGLFNDKGQLIGIVNAKLPSSSIDNIAYAIPSSIVKNVADKLIKTYEVTGKASLKKVVLGITIQVTKSSAVFDKATSTTKIFEEITIKAVSSTSPLYGYAFEGDIIKSITFGGRTYEATRNFVILDACINGELGMEFTMKVIRNGKEIELTTNSKGEAFKFITESSLIG